MAWRAREKRQKDSGSSCLNYLYFQTLRDNFGRVSRVIDQDYSILKFALWTRKIVIRKALAGAL